MPAGGGTAIGNILGAFAGPGTIKYQNVDPALTGRLGNIWSEYDTSADPKNNANYLAAYAANTPQAKQISQGNIGFLNQYAQGAAFDPTANYSKLLDANKQALGSFLLDPALNQLTQQRKAQQAAAGYGGNSGAGTYDQLLQSRTLQQLASQAVPNLLGNTNAAYQTAGNQAQQNFQNRMGIIGSGQQYQQLDTPAMRYLEPTRLARSDVQANLGNLGAIAKQQDLNRAYYNKPDALTQWSNALNQGESGLINEASDVASLYGKAQTGGLVGGGGGAGGMGGIGSMFGGGGGGGGSSGGGGGQPALNSMLQAYLAQQRSGGNPYGSSPYGASPYGAYNPYGGGSNLNTGQFPGESGDYGSSPYTYDPGAAFPG